ELAKIADLSSQRRIATIRSDFVVQDRRIATDHFALKIGRVPMTLAGWTDYDGRLEYQIQVDKLSEHLPEKAQRFLEGLDLDVQRMMKLALRGDVNHMNVQLNGGPLQRDLLRASGLREEDRERLRILGRQLRDRIRR